MRELIFLKDIKIMVEIFFLVSIIYKSVVVPMIFSEIASILGLLAAIVWYKYGGLIGYAGFGALMLGSLYVIWESWLKYDSYLRALTTLEDIVDKGDYTMLTSSNSMVRLIRSTVKVANDILSNRFVKCTIFVIITALPSIITNLWYRGRIL